jgi:peptidoglycan/xylan/chitin deacetylase (PgdA/CDA1 family)
MDLIDQVRNRLAPSPRTVVFTVDDGYADFAEVAAPVFQRYDCPVTVFLITGFLDGGYWLWWDRVRYAVEHSRQTSLTFEFPGNIVRYEWQDPSGRARACRDLIHRLKHLPNHEREAAHIELEARLEVSLPASPPLEFAPMSWEQVRSLGRSGVTFGPHTVSHPILARTTDQQSRNEIFGSWERLQTQSDRALPIFCWPNGDPTSFGPRETRLAAEAGMVAALSTVPASLTLRQWTGNSGGGAYALPRYAYPQDTFNFAQVVSGLERLKGIARTDIIGRNGS